MAWDAAPVSDQPAKTYCTPVAPACVAAAMVWLEPGSPLERAGGRAGCSIDGQRQAGGGSGECYRTAEVCGDSGRSGEGEVLGSSGPGEGARKAGELKAGGCSGADRDGAAGVVPSAGGNEGAAGGRVGGGRQEILRGESGGVGGGGGGRDDGVGRGASIGPAGEDVLHAGGACLCSGGDGVGGTGSPLERAGRRAGCSVDGQRQAGGGSGDRDGDRAAAGLALLGAGPEEGSRSALIVVLGGDPGGGPGDIGYPGLVELSVE